MKMIHETTGDIFEVLPPNEIGESALLLNGSLLEWLLFSDEDGGSVTLESGRVIRDFDEFGRYVVERLRRVGGGT